MSVKFLETRTGLVDSAWGRGRLTRFRYLSKSKRRSRQIPSCRFRWLMRQLGSEYAIIMYCKLFRWHTCLRTLSVLSDMSVTFKERNALGLPQRACDHSSSSFALESQPIHGPHRRTPPYPQHVWSGRTPLLIGLSPSIVFSPCKASMPPLLELCYFVFYLPSTPWTPFYPVAFVYGSRAYNAVSIPMTSLPSSMFCLPG